MESQHSKQAIQKKQVSRSEFEKRVEIEAAHLEYFNRLPRDEARRLARIDISQSYEVNLKM